MGVLLVVVTDAVLSTSIIICLIWIHQRLWSFDYFVPSVYALTALQINCEQFLWKQFSLQKKNSLSFVFFSIFIFFFLLTQQAFSSWWNQYVLWEWQFGFEVVEESQALSGTPGRAPLIMDRSLCLLCQVPLQAWLKCFQPGFMELLKKKSLCFLLISKCQNLNLKSSRTLSKRLQDGLNGCRRIAVGKVFTQFIFFPVMTSPLSRSSEWIFGWKRKVKHSTQP